MRKSVIILYLLACVFNSPAQNTIGIPDIVNYNKSAYNAGTSNWDIVQDKNGIVYFANTEGLLSFDGAYWKTYLFPNKTMARSIAIGSDNRIYAGCQDDLGYFSPDRNGKLVFNSLKSLLSDNATIPSVWDIVSHENDVFFRSETKIFRYNNGSLSVYLPRSEWRFLGSSNNQVIAQDSENGLLRYVNGVWTPFLEESEMPKNIIVTAIISIGKDSSLITTQKNGLFILSGNKATLFKFPGVNPFANELILSCAAVNQNWIAIGTQLNGCYIINKKGEIIQNFSRKEGLQTNCVLSLYLDKNRNLWMGLDNGIDFTAYNNGIKHIYPEHLNEGAGYSSLIFKNELYIGTSNRLYKIPVNGEQDLSYNKGDFTPIPDTKGSAWGLFDINGDLMMAHHDGAYKIEKGTAIPLNKNTGYWNFIPFYNVLPSPLVIAGKYTGLDFYDYKDHTFILKGGLPDFKEASRFAAIDNNNNIIWIAHTFKGVYRINIESKGGSAIKLYTDKNGLPSAISNKLFKIKNRIVVATEKGIYEYNEKKDAFEFSSYFKPIFFDHNIRYLKEDTMGNVWFIEGKMPGVVDFSEAKPKTIYFPELNGRIPSGFENINPINRNNIIVGAEKGFYHINYEQYRKNNYQIEARIRSVRAIGRSDSLLFGGYFSEASDTIGQDKSAIPKVANKWNSFHFEFSSPLNEYQNSVEFSYFLKGLDPGWSSWSKKTEKEYTNLAAGEYTFQVKAKNYLGNESHISSFSFTVLPPWYQTVWAYFVYVLVFCAGIFILYNRQKRKFLQQQKKHEHEQKQLQYLHQLELDKSEKEIIALKNEKLQSQIEHKNTELASVAMHLVQKGELLTKIKEELTRIKNGNANYANSANGNANAVNGNGNGGNGNGNHDTHNNEEFKKILRILKEEDKLDKDWEHFAVHFDNVHSDFLKDMKDHYPNLSAHELKLCAYLRMNLSSKEIAQLMNISVRGVEISRYRLRKKLLIPTETNLFDFLMKFSSSKTH